MQAFLDELGAHYETLSVDFCDTPSREANRVYIEKYLVEDIEGDITRHL